MRQCEHRNTDMTRGWQAEKTVGQDGILSYLPACLLSVILALAAAPVQAETPEEIAAPTGPLLPAAPPGPPPHGFQSVGPVCPKGGLNYLYGPEWEPDEDCFWLFKCVSFYVKTGPVFGLSSGFYEETIKPGWSIEVDARQPIGTAGPLVFFGELGGGFAYNRGEEVEVTEETFFDPDLKDLRRASVHTAFGGYYFPAWLNQPGERKVNLNLRLGGRVGHVHARYESTVFATPGLKNTEILTGLFGSVGTGVTFYNLDLGFFPHVDVTIGAEVEFAHDWFDLGSFGRDDHGLATVVPALTVAFSF